MKQLAWLIIIFSACRCGDGEGVQVVGHVPELNEAGPVVELPEAVKPVIPNLGRLVKDEASVERQVIELKNLGLGHLIDAG